MYFTSVVKVLCIFFLKKMCFFHTPPPQRALGPGQEIKLTSGPSAPMERSPWCFTPKCKGQLCKLTKKANLRDFVYCSGKYPRGKHLGVFIFRLLFTDPRGGGGLYPGTSGPRPACPPTHYPGSVFWPKIGNAVPVHPSTPSGVGPSAKKKPVYITSKR